MIDFLFGIARRALLPVLLSCVAPSALAGVVTLHESELDDIFAQAGIDIRIDATRTIVNPDWTAMSNADFRDAGNYITAPAQGLAASTVPVFFIDDFNQDIASAVVGLGYVDSRFLAVESAYAARPGAGSVLVAHELAHNLGLQHDFAGYNLMYPSIAAANTGLLPYQIFTIQHSRYVQTDALGQRFVQIAPFAVVAALPVPEPETWGMLLGGLGVIAFARRRRQQA